MFSKIYILASLLAAAAASVVPPPKDAFVPADITFNRHALNVTNVDVSPDRAAVDPTLIFCNAANCVNCFRFTLSPLNTCLTPTEPGPFLSAAIDNPDGTPIALDVLIAFVPSVCPAGLVQIPQTNVCFNLNPSGGNAFAVVAGSTP